MGAVDFEETRHAGVTPQERRALVDAQRARRQYKAEGPTPLLENDRHSNIDDEPGGLVLAQLDIKRVQPRLEVV